MSGEVGRTRADRPALPFLSALSFLLPSSSHSSSASALALAWTEVDLVPRCVLSSAVLSILVPMLLLPHYVPG